MLLRRPYTDKPTILVPDLVASHEIFFVHCGSTNLSSARPRKTRSNTVLYGAKVTMVRTYTKGATLRTLNRCYRQSKQSITISPLLNVIVRQPPPHLKRPSK